ncbi:MAG: hypothetical protein KAS13_08945 [Candidatus Omnitrophica bacterium]|nr:hypothetical protein [Candidatus Omnitrophota bacterium]
MSMVDSKEKIAIGKNKELEVTLVLVFFKIDKSSKMRYICNTDNLILDVKYTG